MNNAGLDTARNVCLQFDNTDAARNADPQKMTDDQADAIFAGLALQLKPAVQANPKRWASLNRSATKLRKLLIGTGGSDDDIENAIGDFAKACDPVRKA